MRNQSITGKAMRIHDAISMSEIMAEKLDLLYELSVNLTVQDKHFRDLFSNMSLLMDADLKNAIKELKDFLGASEHPEAKMAA